MTQYDRDEFACHLCFNDKTLQQWIKEESSGRGQCPWCGRKGHLIPLVKLGEPFREVVDSLYITVEDSLFFDSGELISFRLDDDWHVFSERIHDNDLAQQLVLAILYAGVCGKEYYDHPDYAGLFRHHDHSLEDSWDERAYAALSDDTPSSEGAADIARQINEGLPSQLEVAFEDLATTYNAENKLYRARVHDDRLRTKRFGIEELGAPPPERACAGRANQTGRPVLYLATNRSTAFAEVRPWKGAAVAVAEIRPRHDLFLVDLTRQRPLRSPFFVELLRWRVELDGLLYRLGSDMSWPVKHYKANEQEVLYRPTQLLASLIKASGYHGCIYPSAMGSGPNIVLFNPADAEVTNVTYFRIKRAAYYSKPFSVYEQVYEEGPYDHAVEHVRHSTC